MLSPKKSRSSRRNWIYALAFFGILIFYHNSHSAPHGATEPTNENTDSALVEASEEGGATTFSVPGAAISEASLDGHEHSLTINGQNIGSLSIESADSNGVLRDGINGTVSITGVSASLSDAGELILTAEDGRAIHLITTGHVADELGLALSNSDLPGESHGGGHGNLAPYFLALVLILLLAKLGGDIMERLNQPAVLGELIFGVILGNLALFGLHNEQMTDYLVFLKKDAVISTLAEIGVVLLLFQIGLESTVGEMRKVGFSAFLVAIIGVVVPFFLGFGVAHWFLPEANQMVHVFIGAVLCATSVGITARVLQDIGKLDTKESKIILGAAVVDDVLGLVVLAVISGVIKAKGAGEALAMSSVLMIVVKAGAFFVGSIVIGVYLSPKLFHLASYLRGKGVLLTLSLTLCFLFSWLAGLIDLAPIVGAFCAGLILEEASFRELGDYRTHNLEALIAPIAAFLVPIFFVRMGLQVSLEAFKEEGILLFATCLTIAAIIGKQVCSFGVREKGVDGIAVALGMIPRGEVGLIFASIGMGLVLAGKPVIDETTYSAIVIMVMVTTLVTPPILTWRFKRGKGAAEVPAE